MSAQYSFDTFYERAQSEYDSEVVSVKLYKEKANHGYLKFIRAIQKQMAELTEA